MYRKPSYICICAILLLSCTITLATLDTPTAKPWNPGIMTIPVNAEEFVSVSYFVNWDSGPGYFGEVDDSYPTYSNHSGTDYMLHNGLDQIGGIVRWPFRVPGLIRQVGTDAPDTPDANANGGLGNYIFADAWINGDNSDGGVIKARFAHLSGASILVGPGQEVVYPGQPLARVSYSGRTGYGHYHLHMECTYKSKILCPLRDGLLSDGDCDYIMRRKIGNGQLTINGATLVHAVAGDTVTYRFHSTRPIATIMHTYNPTGPVIGFDMLYELQDWRRIDDYTVEITHTHKLDPKLRGLYEYKAIDDDGNESSVVAIVIY